MRSEQAGWPRYYTWLGTVLAVGSGLGAEVLYELGAWLVLQWRLADAPELSRLASELLPPLTPFGLLLGTVVGAMLAVLVPPVAWLLRRSLAPILIAGAAIALAATFMELRLAGPRAEALLGIHDTLHEPLTKLAILLAGGALWQWLDTRRRRLRVNADDFR